MSCVGLTSGTGSEGACITSKMYWGGLSYPDVLWTGVAATEVTFAVDDLDCAAIGRQIAATTTPPTTKEFKFFRTVIGFSA